MFRATYICCNCESHSCCYFLSRKMALNICASIMLMSGSSNILIDISSNLSKRCASYTLPIPIVCKKTWVATSYFYFLLALASQKVELTIFFFENVTTPKGSSIQSELAFSFKQTVGGCKICITCSWMTLLILKCIYLDSINFVAPGLWVRWNWLEKNRFWRQPKLFGSLWEGTSLSKCIGITISDFRM